MIPVGAAVRDFAAQIAEGSAALGRRVEVDVAVVGERAGFLGLKRPGAVSANGSCRMVEAADGWLAVNLPRDADLLSVPAWVGCGLEDDPWSAVTAAARLRSADGLVEDAQRLGLAVARVDSVSAPTPDAPLRRMAAGGAARGPLKVIDMSSLWAGPLCGDLLARAGAQVVKLESLGRPDGTRISSPAFHARLNGRKTPWRLDLASAADIGRLRAALAETDLVITSARPRAFDQLGLAPETVFAANPRLVWVAVTAYGWTEGDDARVGFGDDCAAAGGLVRWSPQGRPLFRGDALADPLTGLAAAAGAFRALETGGGVLVDAALARTAAGVAAGTVREAAA